MESSRDFSFGNGMVSSSQSDAFNGVPLPSDAFSMDMDRPETLDSFWNLSWPELVDPTSWILDDGPFEFGNGPPC